MKCLNCSNNFDHSIHKPYSLSHCTHTFCIQCLNKCKESVCPRCKESFSKINLNSSLLEFIPKSEWDKKIEEINAICTETVNLHSTVVTARGFKLEDINLKFEIAVEQINKKTEQIINLILTKRDELLAKINQTRETFLFHNPIQVEEIKIEKLKSILNKNEILNEEAAKKLINEFKKSTNNLNKLLARIENFNQPIEFVPNVNQNSINIGHMSFQQKTLNEFKQLGDDLNKSNQFEEAIFYYDMALDAEQNQANIAELFSIKSRILKKLDKKSESNEFFNKAVEQYDKIIQSDNKNHLIMFLKSQLMIEHGQNLDASKLLEKAIEIDGKNKKYRDAKTKCDQLLVESAKKLKNDSKLKNDKTESSNGMATAQSRNPLTTTQIVAENNQLNNSKTQKSHDQNKFKFKMEPIEPNGMANVTSQLSSENDETFSKKRKLN